MKTIETDVYTDFQTKGPLLNRFWNENVTATFWVWSFSLWRFKILKNVAVAFSVPQPIHEWPLKRAFFDKFFPVKISIQCCKINHSKINHIMNYIIVITITTDKTS